MLEQLVAAKQQSYAHGIQLTVLDVQFKRADNGATLKETEVHRKSDDDSDDEEDGETFESFDDADVIAELSDNYQLLINKVRANVKIFR